MTDQKGLTETCPVCHYTTAALLSCQECRISACFQCIEQGPERQLCMQCYEKAETELID